MTSHVDQFTAIVKHRYETGAYGSCHFRMTSALWEAVRTLLPKPTPSPMPWAPPSLDPLLAYRWLEAIARGIEDGARDIAEMLGVEEWEIEPLDEADRSAKPLVLPSDALEPGERSDG